jgi:hypothetical protein
LEYPRHICSLSEIAIVLDRDGKLDNVAAEIAWKRIDFESFLNKVEGGI